MEIYLNKSLNKRDKIRISKHFIKNFIINNNLWLYQDYIIFKNKKCLNVFSRKIVLLF